jgi:hypothetical protein
MRRLLAIALLCALAACNQPVAPEKLARIKTVGVLSLAGDDIGLTNVGIVVFANEYHSANMESWGLRQYLADTIRAELGKHYQVQTLTYDKADFAPGTVSWIASEESVFAAPKPKATEVIRTRVTPAGLDAYIVVLPSARPVGSTNQSAAGFGLVRTGAPFIPRVAAHAYYSILVIDGHDYTLIGAGRSIISETGIPGEDYPLLMVGTGQWADSVETMSEQQKAKLRQELQSLIAESVPLTLHSLKLMP